jgi:hypothetical protein
MKRRLIDTLTEAADSLDVIGLHKEADVVSWAIGRVALTSSLQNLKKTASSSDNSDYEKEDFVADESEAVKDILHAISSLSPEGMDSVLSGLFDIIDSAATDEDSEEEEEDSDEDSEDSEESNSSYDEDEEDEDDDSPYLDFSETDEEEGSDDEEDSDDDNVYSDDDEDSEY